MTLSSISYKNRRSNFENQKSIITSTLDLRPSTLNPRFLTLFPLPSSLFLLFAFLLFSTSLIAQRTSVSVWQDPEVSIDDRVVDLIMRMTLEEKCSQMLYNSPAIERLGIPEYNWWNEALHGVARMGRATVFPQPIGMAATFDSALIYQVASAISDEARAKYNAAVKIGNRTQYGGLTFWSPNINIFRDPRWGRGMETWGEDPCLTGKLGVAFVQGMQGDNPRYLKTAACAKHFVVHSGPEKLRHEFNAKPPVKDFRETYLPAFKQLVQEGHVESVMCAYNRTYGEPCCGSPFLLQEILRNEWGFEGHIVSDCWALTDFNQFHKVTASNKESAVKAVLAGVDLNCGVAYRELVPAVREGLITEADIELNLAYLLRTRFRLGLFDPPGMNPWEEVSDTVINCVKHKKIAREVATKSIVLLKNNGILPLKQDLHRYIVTGPLAADVNVLLGNYNGVAADAVTILEGIASTVDPGSRISYHSGFLLTGEDPDAPRWTLFDINNADATIIVMGINPLFEGEDGEALATTMGADKTDIQIPDNQIRYLKALVKDRKKPVIAVITGGSPLDLSEVYELVDALVFAWYPGEQGGNAVADVLFGKTSPAGRLPITFPKSVDQLPPFDDYSMVGRTYRYMEKEPLFPFGFGLSYTTFRYENLVSGIRESGGVKSLQVSFTVSNTGSIASDEVIQLYLSRRDVPFRAPLYDLKGFQRICLNPGETKKVTFNISSDDLLLINEDGESVYLPGNLNIFVGGSLPTERSRELGAGSWLEAEVKLK
ncbi:glycoside hydrolase family 3 C-terminal domain-containing protein [Bacteroidota bacterium]